MLINIASLFIIILFIVELYFCAAASAHKRVRLLPEWNPVKGKIVSISKEYDKNARKNYSEMKVETIDRIVTVKLKPLFNIYEVGEEVDLMEKNGVHRFRGNDRVNAKSKKELAIGMIPILVIIGFAAICSYIF